MEKPRPEIQKPPEKLLAEIANLSQNVSTLKNVVSILQNAGTDALKKVLKKK